MRINDNRPEVAYNKVFVGSGTDETIKTATDEDASRSAYSSGKEALKNASYGYISYVKGENPFTFPYRVYPKDHSPRCSFFSEGGSAVPFPTVNFDNVPYPASDIAKETRFLDIYLTPIGQEQQRVYDMCIELLKTSKDEKEKDEPASAAEVGSDSDVDSNESDDSNSIASEASEASEASKAKEASKPKQKPAYDEIGTKFGFKSRNALQALTMTFPGNGDASDPKSLVGQNGFKQVMTSAVTSKNGQDVVKYTYKDGVERVFARENIGKWSNKIASVCKHAEECEGIVLVYTEYIEGGAVPVALALEEHGFRRYGGDNLLTNPSSAESQPGTHKKSKPSYTLITGNKMLTPTSVVSVATAKNNAKGQIIKVIVITKAGSEGIDLKNIRQVHVIDPWYNLSLIEQVIGRAVRNCSHVDLPFEQRNVCIFIHGTRLLGEGRDTVEAIDVSLLHHAENKAKRIGNVNRILKKNAVDCNLNKGYNVPQFKEGNSVVRQVLTTLSSSSDESQRSPIVIERYDVQMKPRTDACDYQDECDFGCEPLIDDAQLQTMGTDMDTYNMKFLELNSERVIHRVRALFKERFFYTEDELFRHVNQVRTYTDEQVMVAIHTLITDPYEMLTDGYGRSGRLVQIGNYYLFQPDGITNPKIGLRERAMPIDEGVDAIQVDVRQQQQQLLQQPVVQDAQNSQLIGKLFRTYKMLSEPVSATTDEFVLYASKFMNKITETGIADRKPMLLIGMSHYLDMLSLEEIKQIANRSRASVAADQLNSDVAEFEKLLDKYIEQCAFPCTTSQPNAQRQILISTTDKLTSWTDASDNKVKPRSEDTADSYVRNYVKRMLETKIDFIARANENEKDTKWKTSTEIPETILSALRACVSNWFLSGVNLPLVQSTGKDNVFNGIPYKVGCLRWSSAKKIHEFILIDLKIQKSVIHGQVPTKKTEVAELLEHILSSMGKSLTTFVKEKDKDKEGEREGIVKKAKGDVKESIQGLIVFTELLLRVLDIRDKQKMDGSGHRWMLRPCELQLVTKVGSIYHANKQQPKL